MTDRHLDHGKEIPLSWFIEPLRKYTRLYIELFGIAVAVRLCGLVEPFILQVIIDRVLPFQRESSLVVIVVIFIIVSLFQMTFDVQQTILGVSTANRVVREFGRRIFGHLFKLPTDHFRRWPVGETIARVTETDTIQEFLVGATMGVLLDIMFLFIYLSVLFFLSPLLAWIVLASLPMQLLVYLSFGPFLRRRLRAEFHTGAEHKNLMVESLTGASTVKALSVENPVLHRLDMTLKNNLHARYRVATLGLWSGNITFMINRGVTIAVIYFGASLIFIGELTLGQFIAFHILSARVTGPIANFAQLWESWQNIKISRQRLGDIVNQDMEPFDQLPKLPVNINPCMTFENVWFGYSMEIPPIICNFNCEIMPNTLTLIIGPSGIGKSTLGRLAAGLDAPKIGRVLLDGKDIAQYDPHDVRTKIAYVSQDPYLFLGTIRENLMFGADGITDKEIKRALKIAAADALIEQLPKGLDTQVGERGSALSGGQRHRIAIARSLLKKPKIIILDEPTSALDDDAQRVMASELERMKETITLIIITHRPDIFEQVDQVHDLDSDMPHD